MAAGGSRSFHGGDSTGLASASSLLPRQILDAGANINPLGPPAWLDAAFAEGRRSSGDYPDPGCRHLRAVASLALGVPEECLVFGNGADELMFGLARAISAYGHPWRENNALPFHLIEAPSYASYREAALDAAGLLPTQAGSIEAEEVLRVIPARLPRRISADRDETAPGYLPSDFERWSTALAASPPGSILWLGAPNNPTGLMPEGYPESVVELAKNFSDKFIFCDEAFIDFAEGLDPGGASKAAAGLPNLIVIRSLSNFWAVPGLRAGYVICHPQLAGRLRMALPNWPLNCVALAFALRAFRDPLVDTRRDNTRKLVHRERSRMAAALSALPGLEVRESAANFYLVRVRESIPSLADALAARGIGLRRCTSIPGLGSHWLRIAVSLPEENDRILKALEELFLPRPAPSGAPVRLNRHSISPAHPPALMIQGCSSGAGKSLIAAAFCRIFHSKGYDVAPYKAQNMSLNSAVTLDGLELGRAQAIQAAACGLEPDVRMNPVLLKPESDCGSQIVLMGKPYARFSAQEYYKLHADMRQTAWAAYDSLASEHRLMVLEGAGSPGEINLKDRDFVNMGAARHAGARVLLVGDIDRGGVFASFIGHVATFAPDELDLLCGFLVNKFRGDPSLLGDAFAMTEERTGYPVLGCVPMIPGLIIADEDETVIKTANHPDAALRIAVPRLRRVSNFTDFDAFAVEPDVAIIAVDSGETLRSGNWDAIIIPGTKSTASDLEWLRSNGLAEAIRSYAAKGGTVVGICGGFQMLGEWLLDPDGVESPHPCLPGLGLLPLTSTFGKEKRLSRIEAEWLADGTRLKGYEIHHGQTGPSDPAKSSRSLMDALELKVILKSLSGEALGYGSGMVWGSYLHGIFDADGFRRKFLNRLREAKGLPSLGVHPAPDLEAELGRLADAVRTHVNLERIEKELGL